MNDVWFRRFIWAGVLAGRVAGEERSQAEAESERRGRERYTRAAMSTTGSVIERVVASAAMFVSVPLILNYLGAETYGVVLAMASGATLLASLDFGIPHGLTNHVSEAHGRDDRAFAAVFVASAFYLALVIAAGLILVTIAVTSSGLFDLLGFDRSTREGAPRVLAVISVCLLLNVPLNLANFVQIGYQESFWNQGWNTLAASVGLLAVFCAVRADTGLFAVLLASFGIPLATAAANSAFLFARRRAYLCPRVANIRFEAVRALLTGGLPLFALHAATAVAIWTDEIVIALTFGAASVPSFSIPAKIFNLIPLAVGLVVTPLWPAYREAITRGDRQWVARTLAVSTSLSLVLSTVGAGVLFLFRAPIIQMWVGEAVEEAPGVVSGLAVWTVVVSYSSSLLMLQQGLNRVRTLAAWAVFAALVALILKIVAAMGIGVGGVVWARTLAYAALFAVPLSIETMRTVRDWKADRVTVGKGRICR